MTIRQEVLVPDIGDFTDVEIVEVMVSVGDEVAAEDSLITIETDKAAMDVPAPVAGRITEMSVGEGDKVSEGSLILVLEAVQGEAPVAESSQPEKPVVAAEIAAPAARAETVAPVAAPKGQLPAVSEISFAKAHVDRAALRGLGSG